MMGRTLRVMLCACCGAAAVFASGAGSAFAAPASLAARNTVNAPSQTVQWNLSGSNSIDVGYDGQDLVYTVSFTQSGTSLTGTLTDSYYPTSGPISGTVSGNSVTFTFDYPSGSIQGTRTYTGTISQSGAVSGTWTQTGSESPDNGTWSLANNAVAGSGSGSPPTSACTAATQAYDNDQTSLDKLLSQLSAAEASQRADQYRISVVAREVDSDNALIAKYKDLESASEDDAEVVSQVLASFVEETLDIKDNPTGKALDKLVNEVQEIAQNTLEPEAEDIDSDVAGSSWQEAAAAEGEEAAAAGEALEAIEVTPEKVFDRQWIFALAVDAGKIVTADIALKAVLVQLDALDDQYQQANSEIAVVTDELNADKAQLNSLNATINALNSQIAAAQAAAQAALEAMTSACKAG